MQEICEINVLERTAFGKSAAKSTRDNKLIPCVVYGKFAGKQEYTHYAIRFVEAYKLLQQKKFFMHSYKLIDENGKTIGRVMPKEVQFHPLTDAPLHFDFMLVNDESVVIVNIPLILKNSTTAPGLREGGQIKIYKNSIKMRVPFKNMCISIEVDLGRMQVQDVIYVKDISMPAEAVLLNASLKDKIAFMKYSKAETAQK